MEINCCGAYWTMLSMSLSLIPTTCSGCSGIVSLSCISKLWKSCKLLLNTFTCKLVHYICTLEVLTGLLDPWMASLNSAPSQLSSKQLWCGLSFHICGKLLTSWGTVPSNIPVLHNKNTLGCCEATGTNLCTSVMNNSDACRWHTYFLRCCLHPHSNLHYTCKL